MSRPVHYLRAMHAYVLAREALTDLGLGLLQIGNSLTNDPFDPSFYCGGPERPTRWLDSEGTLLALRLVAELHRTMMEEWRFLPDAQRAGLPAPPALSEARPNRKPPRREAASLQPVRHTEAWSGCPG